MAIALVRDQQIEYRLHGFADIDHKVAVRKDSLFEIGSVTKPLIALASLSMLQNGQWALEQSIPALVALKPSHKYSLAALLTHRSGLPRLPANMPLHDLTAPYATYKKDDLLQSLQQTQLGDADFSYSNYGYGLLGFLLELSLQQPLADIMRQRVLRPLAMNSAELQVPGYNNKNRASGYALNGQKMAHWHFDALAGAGAVVASVEDMAQMLSSIFRLQQTDALIRQWLTPLDVDGEPKMTPGWMSDKNWLWHSGQTAGFSSVVVFDPQLKTGIVILSNLSAPLNRQGFELAQQFAQNEKVQEKTSK